MRYDSMSPIDRLSDHQSNTFCGLPGQARVSNFDHSVSQVSSVSAVKVGGCGATPNFAHRLMRSCALRET
jgi:hypothetical protein